VTPERRRNAVIIEDDSDIRHLLEQVLTQAGFLTVSAANGEDGVRAVAQHDPVVTTLDVNMPGVDGFEVARRLRGFSDTYIVMITAMDEEIDVLRGLDAGADDYVTKPFRPRELRARIEAMLRRPRVRRDDPGITELGPNPPSTVSVISPSLLEQALEDDWLECDGLRLSPGMRIVEADGRELELTRAEFDLLEALMRSGRRVRSKTDLALILHGEDAVVSDFVSSADKRAVEVHVANLRRKLGDTPTQPRWIETVRGIGYRMSS